MMQHSVHIVVRQKSKRTTMASASLMSGSGVCATQRRIALRALSAQRSAASLLASSQSPSGTAPVPTKQRRPGVTISLCSSQRCLNSVEAVSMRRPELPPLPSGTQPK
jgi:hypothetical protein